MSGTRGRTSCRRFSAPTSAAFWIAAAVYFLGIPTALAYRVTSDSPALSELGAARWGSHVVSFRVDSRGAPGVGLAATVNATLDGLAAWETLECGRVDFRYDGAGGPPTPGDGVNTIGWLPEGLAGLGLPPDAVGFTDILYDEQSDGSWAIVEADIYFDGSAFAWTTSSYLDQSGVRSIPAVVAHEAGHVLGLLHPCEPGGLDGAPTCASDPSFLVTTMYPIYEGVSQATLDDDDIAGFCSLYASAPCTVSCGEGALCDGDVCLEPCGDSLCGAQEVCSNGTCQPDCGGFLCQVEPECTVDADCPQGTACAYGECEPPQTNLVGDPCAASSECSTNLCFDGYCTLACTDSCPSAFTCAGATADTYGVCEADEGVLGEQCQHGEDCVSGVCILAEGRAFGTCTRACSSQIQCPPEFPCEPVDHASYCLPATPSGCSIGLGRGSLDAPSSTGFFLFLGLLLLVTHLRPRGTHA